MVATGGESVTPSRAAARPDRAVRAAASKTLEDTEPGAKARATRASLLDRRDRNAEPDGGRGDG